MIVILHSVHSHGVHSALCEDCLWILSAKRSDGLRDKRNVGGARHVFAEGFWCHVGSVCLQEKPFWRHKANHFSKSVQVLMRERDHPCEPKERVGEFLQDFINEPLFSCEAVHVDPLVLRQALFQDWECVLLCVSHVEHQRHLQGAGQTALLCKHAPLHIRRRKQLPVSWFHEVIQPTLPQSHTEPRLSVPCDGIHHPVCHYGVPVLRVVGVNPESPVETPLDLPGLEQLCPDV
mmetsp:Transcript_10760/g.20824  ORF Transcript_10760/g.20824 Transcript_10760/m.20824 type:complete len:234 (+) Transcript_10760:94-795(+)